jgi:hypothetical protein
MGVDYVQGDWISPAEPFVPEEISAKSDDRNQDSQEDSPRTAWSGEYVAT